MLLLWLQASAGWKHGDGLDERAKTHPLLKPYKALSEKVQAHWYTRTRVGVEGAFFSLPIVCRSKGTFILSEIHFGLVSGYWQVTL